MRRILAALAVVLALPVLAQDAPRIAIFSPDQVAGNTKRGKQIFTDLEALGKTLQERINVKVEELKKVDQQLKSPGLSEEGRAKLQRELQDGDLALKRIQEDSQQEFEKTKQKAMKTFMEEVEPIIKDVAREMKLHAVLTYQPGMLAWADDSWLNTFTTEVAKRFDERAAAKPGAPAAKPAAPAAKPAAPAAKPSAPAPKK
jgi:Skp family chaperone for outer membrane proteins